MPSTLTGCLHPSNRHCIHWSPSGVIATACHNVLTLIDAFSLQRVQTIEHHAAAINQVAWSPPHSLCTQQHDEGPRIASADISGQIIVCDPVSGEKRAQFSLPNCNVLAMSWFPWRDISRDFLLVLHTGDQLVLWNADSGEKVWTRQLPNNSCTMMALCPFEQEQVAVASRDCLLLLSDVHLNQPPSSPPTLLSVDGPIDSIVFHSAYSNQLLVVHGDSLSCVETQVSAVLYRITVDSAPVAVLPAGLRDVLYTVQSSGSVTLRSATCETDERGDCRMGLATLATGEAPRSCRAVAAALCPTTQANLAVLMANGKIVLWQLDSSTLSPPPYRSVCLDDLLSFNAQLETRPVGKLRLRQSGQLSSLSTGLSTVRMRPMEGATDGAHLAAVGTSSGRIHLVDVFTCEVVKEFTVQSSPIKCLEWGGPHLLISAGYNHALSQTSSVRNDIHITDIRTGETRRLRQECDETPISMLRVSFYHCYLALAFQKEPLEIWDLKSFRLLRKMSRTCPLISDMAWSCKHHGVKTTAEGGAPVYRENLVVLDADNRLYHIVVKGMHVRDGKEVNTQWKSGGWSIRAMAWKDDCLAMGDADGRISVWDLSRRQSRQTRAARLPVLRMAFSRLAGDHTLAVLHQRELIVWDTDALHKMQTVQLDASVAALDMDLCGVSPLFVCNDNTFRHQPPGTPVTAIPNKLLPPLLSDALMTQLSEAFSASSSTHPSMQRLIEISSGDDPLTRASRLRRFLGEPAAWSLLTLAAHHKRREREGGEEGDHLPPCLQLHWPQTTFRLREQLVASAAVRSSSDEAAVVERAVVAGGRAREQAVDRLIGSPDLRCASLQAALLVSDQSSEQAKSLIKLIATNLIASDMVREGVQLLFLVGAGGDACKYLQSQRLWTKSVQYAKMGLADPEEPLSKWAAYMQIDHRSEFVRAEVCRGEWESARSVLTAVGRTGLAEALQKYEEREKKEERAGE